MSASASATIDPTQPPTTTAPTTMEETSVGPTSDSESSATSGETGSTTGGEGVLEGWTRRRLVTIDNVLPDPLDDVQVRLSLVHDADMQTDFEDIRFTAANGTTVRPHWTERSTPLTDADVWVRVPSVPAAGTTDLWLYYGNADAENASDGDATFFFFDDFAGAALDGMQWSATSEHTVGGGRLEVLTGAVYSNEAVVEQGQIVEARIQFPCCESVSELSTFVSSLDDGDVILADHLALVDPTLNVQYNDGGDYGPDAATDLTDPSSSG